MSSRSAFFALVVVFACGSALAQQGQPGAPSAEEKAMMEAFDRMAKVGDNHKLLGAMAGEWNTVVRSWMKPGAEPMESKGVSSDRPVMGGRYIQTDFKGDFMGQPFQGFGMSGYDNVTGKFWSTWSDSMSTGVMHVRGTYDAASKPFTYRGEMPDPMKAGALVKFRETVKIVDADKHVFEMYETHEGVETKTMEITYTRKK